MKKQSGFTLIELLLVLAIIGIISAIAIPALLSQRARARDKAAITNMTGRLGDLIGQYDKAKEAGETSATIPTILGSYLQATGGSDRNPWNTTGASTAFNYTIKDMGPGTTQSAAIDTVRSYAVPGTKGQAQFGISFPGAGTPGFIAGAVYVDNKVNGSNTVAKASAVE